MSMIFPKLVNIARYCAILVLLPLFAWPQSVIQGLSTQRPKWEAKYINSFYAPTDNYQLWIGTSSRWKMVGDGDTTSSTGTVTSISTGWGLSGGPITTAGTIKGDSTSVASIYALSLKLAKSDTTAMLSKYLLKGDTANMLLPYLRKLDTLQLSNRINLKLNITDTTGKWFSTISKEAGTDSIFGYKNGVSTFLFTDSAGTSIDTTSLSNRINLKLNISDTATMLSYYKNKNDSVASSGFTSIYKNGLKVNISDTASMLSPYYKTATATSALALKVNIADTSAMLTNYRLKADTTQRLFGIGVPATPSISFSGATDMGFYRQSTTAIGIAVSGTQNFVINSTNIRSITARGGSILSAAGTVSSPAITFTNNTSYGLYMNTTGSLSTVSVAVNGVETARFDTLGGFVNVATDPTLKECLGMGSTVKATSIPIINIVNSTAMVSGTMIWATFNLSSRSLITGVSYYVVTASNAIETTSNYNGAILYSISGGNLTMIDSTARDTAFFDGSATTFKKKAFANGARILSAGTYVIAMVWNRNAQTTAPTIGNGTNLQNLSVGAFDMTNSCKLFATKAQTTPLTSTTMSALTGVATTYYVGIY